MTSLIAELNRGETAARRSLNAVADASGLEAWRAAYIGRKGSIPRLLRMVKDLPLAERKNAGRRGNEIRQALERSFREKEAQINVDGKKAFSPQSAPAHRQTPPGHLHPLTHTLRQIQYIFTKLGFRLIEGPSVEEARYNFDSLNISLEHPARAETDTYYLKDHPGLVLRTHVSPLQVRSMLENKFRPPVRLMYWGPTFRAEKEDATHGALFQQYEFLVIDETVNLADLKAITTAFYSQFFGTEAVIRLRPSYFPFVEPGLEVDMQDTVTGRGDWLEMAGAGMIHPHVLEAMNVDSSRYQGIALGGGLDRLAMLKYGIPDIRLFYSGNLEFLRQF
ncbi:MAG: phenylalanine--tRNA ligase subunit alpha [Candidatus Andersenbacteria bacterium CG10_big_fil_rev_8_21_14_0_10_54_11]|uniref:Phenylalanine--tRNA ligase alpha subunit n=1 Tax=Candidatus Andersenbacteria bacterium CG10_big_fil_rev_8_21_14_0_10_54_11 TaxID=1974485 RepID=A0A2M6WZ18_9BACT|nr:MAG: phenylalanine--tRNA ligase subunit alpha [Candidatus Andersenbacteria bacterium CG10_big_fil_rev_8_21_14_0_10_54_11]